MTAPVVVLSPIGSPGQQFFDNNGVLLAGGLLYTYAAGTTTPALTYTDSTGATPNANPIVLDSAGRVPSGCWLVSGTSYKIVLKTSAGVTLISFDHILLYIGVTTTQANQIAASAALSIAIALTTCAVHGVAAGQALTAATLTKLQFDTELYDRGANFNPVNYRFTVPADGTYSINAMCNFGQVTPTANKSATCSIYKNGVAYMNGTVVQVDVSHRSDSVVAQTMYLVAGDYIEIWGIGDAGTDWVFNSSNWSTLSIARIS